MLSESLHCCNLIPLLSDVVVKKYIIQKMLLCDEDSEFVICDLRYTGIAVDEQ